MDSRPANVKTENFDMDSFFDFSAGTATPATASSSKLDMTPFEQHEERRQFSGPSHDYNQYKQQVGLPIGSVANLPPMMQSNGMFDGYNSGMGDVGFESMSGWSSGIDMDAEMSMDFNNSSQSTMPPMFFPPQNTDSPADNFINPNSMGGEEPTSNVGRLWPGMHSQQAQQAAMQKAAQAHAVQQRQMKLQAQHAQYRQAANGPASQASSQPSHGHSKRPSHVTEPHVEESISRLLNQMRHNSALSNGDDDDSQNGLLPHIARMKKDEEEMDEDERLLASDEGKKLSSKERRQLRNKVSARAFRSRRKEYIGQLEGEVALKTQEASTLRSENAELRGENERYRALIETVLRHPSFHPFLQDLSKDPSLLGPSRPQPQQQHPHRPAHTPVQQPAQQPPPQQQPQPQQEMKAEYMNFDASQLQVPGQQPQQPTSEQTVGLAMVPENDFSKLNLNGFAASSMNFNNFQSVNAFAVTDVPSGPRLEDLLFLDAPTNSAAPSDTLSGFDSTATAPAANVPADMTTLLANLDRAASRVQAMDTGVVW